MKTVIFDFDGTLHQGLNIWKSLWRKLGYPIHQMSNFRELLNRFREGELTHREWNEITAKAFRQKGLNRKMVWDIAGKIQLLDGVEETFKTLKENGYKIFIVSGNVKEVIQIALQNAGKYVDGIYANKFLYDRHDNFKAINGTDYDYEGKARFIDEYKEKTNTPAQEIVFVGDGDNDEWAHLSGCKTICFNPGDETDEGNRSKWHKVVRSTSLTALLPEIAKNFEDSENDI